MQHSEIRESTKRTLLEKVRKENYGQYLLKSSIEKVRGFTNESIKYDFPVTALIGPNGSGKSSVLGAAGCAYKSIKPSIFFPKSVIGDETMSGWKVEYEIIDKALNSKQPVKRTSNFRQAKWVRRDVVDRKVLFFGIERTVPAGEKPRFKKLMSSSYIHTGNLDDLPLETAKQIEHILGKSVDGFKTINIEHNDVFFIGKTRQNQYSEFHFGAGESSIIRMISQIELAPKNSLILIEEIENGLHPVATRRMVEYLIDVAERKSIQSIFTTHSDYALSPLPNEGIWACIDGKLRQGKLSVEALRAVAGRVDKKLAIFVEDEFAKHWVDCILREHLASDYEQIEVHAVAGDGNAVKIHNSHVANPAISFQSLCIIDGDSQQTEDKDSGIIRLPGSQPETEVFNNIYIRLDDNLAILTVSCHLGHEKQRFFRKSIEEINSTNRDPHLIFNQLGIRIGYIPENIVCSAFLVLWVRQNEEFCQILVSHIRNLIAKE